MNRIQPTNVPFELRNAVLAKPQKGATVLGKVPEYYLVGDPKGLGETWAIPVFKVHKGGSAQNPNFRFLYPSPSRSGLEGLPLKVQETIERPRLNRMA